jgi:PAS domain S-box-containing protein
MLKPSSKRETTHLWLAIAITLALSSYRLSVELIDRLQVAFAPYTALPVSQWLTNALFFWLLILLSVAYRRWRRAIVARLELERVISSISPDVLMVVQPDRAISMCNAGIRAMFGYEEKEVIGQTTDLLYFDRRLSGRPREIYESLQTLGFHVGYATGKRRNGEHFPLEIVTGSLRGAPGAVVLIRDITERRRAEAQVVRAKEEAEAANKAKTEALVQLAQNYEKLKELEELRDQLTHMIVHDLKSPLATISGYLAMLTEQAGPKMDDSGRQFLGEAARLVRRLQGMIVSLLDVGRLEKREMPLNRRTSELEPLACEALHLMAPEGERAPIVIEPAPAPVTAWCDPDIIRRVVGNLLDNAVKFTPVSGEIRVRMETRGPEAWVAVADNGLGIPREYHQRIFERFAQVEARKFSTGLGLTFCKLAVEAHAGRIGVDSETGKGSTFWFVLPVNPPAV